MWFLTHLLFYFKIVINVTGLLRIKYTKVFALPVLILKYEKIDIK